MQKKLAPAIADGITNYLNNKMFTQSHIAFV
jgi:hypothetical protein